ncbi:molybdopterin molybdotransferase MoeA [Paeniglutamicibacter cryotolerans]
MLEPVLTGLGSETLMLSRALHRTLDADVVAPRQLPPFDNSQMDGYAVRTADLAAGLPLGVGRPIAAGSMPEPLESGQAAPIMTGAPIPEGADAVVPIEAAEPSAFPGFVGDRQPYVPGTTVLLPAVVAPGSYIRTRGSDVLTGQPLLPAGTRLGPAQLGLLAGLGIESVTVRVRPRALLLSTGDELAAPGADLAPGQIHDANTTMLSAALLEAGWDVEGTDIAIDDARSFTEALARRLAGAGQASAERRGTPDLVLTSGGISQGAFEVVKLALAAHGVEFGSVAMQPGGPQGAGLLALPGTAEVPLLAFPGNPVSSYVSWEVFLRPACCAYLGLPARRMLSLPLASGLASPHGREQYRRATLVADAVSLTGGESSHLLGSLAQSNALIRIPAHTTSVAPGEMIDVLLIGDAA